MDFAAKFTMVLCDEVQHLPCQSRIHADPEHVVHHEIGVGQIPDHAVFATFVGGLPQQIPAKQQSRSDLLCLQRADQVFALERRVFANSNGKSKPRRDRSPASPQATAETPPAA